ncbi:MAG: restriction endonuclease subunit S [Treponema sp.]|nr:restriction endonuclease subunit S [Treponema sp.]
MEYTIKTINELCTKITDGSHFSPENEESGKFPMYSVKDMEYNNFSNNDCKMIGQEMFEKLSKSDCRPLKNDILIAKDGSYLKYAFKVDKDLDACILSSIAILRPNLKNINPDYFVYLMRTKSIKGAMANYVSGSALPRIILSDFKKMKLKMISSLPTQQKIASILSAYDNLIQNYKKQIEDLQTTASELYKEWFVRFRFPGYKTTQFENGIPVGWKVEKLGNLYDSMSGGTPSREHEEYYQNGIYPWIKTGELKDCPILETEELITEDAIKHSSAKLFKKDSLIIAMYGATIGQLGINKMDATCNQACCVLRPKENKSFGIYYLFHFFKENRDFIIGLGNGAAQQNLSQVLINKLKIVNPSKELLEVFEKRQNLFFEKIYKLQQQITNLTQQRDLLLPRLMSGKLEVK